MFSKLKFGMLCVATGLLSQGVMAADDLDKAAQDPNQWAMNGRGYDNQRFSPLNQINASNVKNLKVAYVLSLGTTRSQESTPIIVGDTIYVSSSWGPKFVYAADVRTGKVKWRYEPELPDDMTAYACCDVNNRGVTYANGMIFLGRLDGHLVALDAKTGERSGKLKWSITPRVR